MIRRGEIYWVNFDSTVGHETQKKRSALVVSNDTNNQLGALITILPITSQTHRVYPFEVALPAGAGGLRDTGKIMANQTRTVDKRRLSNKPTGPLLEDHLMDAVEKAMKIHLALS